MADVVAPETQPAEEALLERQHHREPVHRRGEPPRPTRPPGPELRRDVVEDLGAGLPRRLGHADVEAGVVDEDDEVVSVRPEVGPERAQEPQVGAQLGHDLHQAEGGEPFHRIAHRARPAAAMRGPPRASIVASG